MNGRATAILAFALGMTPALTFAIGFGTNEKEDGGQPGAFLSAAASARPLSLGGAYTGVSDDATAPFWNASGLAQIQRFDLVTYYSRLGEDANIGSGAFALPTRRLGTFGFNAVGLRSGSFRRRDDQNRDLGEFESNASAYMVSQALNVGTRWSAGYTVKAVQQEVDVHSDTGYGVDVGLMARPVSRLQLGLAVQNAVQPELQLKSVSEKLPTEVRLGGRFEPRSNLMFAADVSVVERRSPEVSLGTEWRVSGPLALRIGANDRELSAGVGVTAGDLGLDYAFGFPHASVVRTELGSSHRVSFHLRFGSNVMSGSYRDLTRRREEQHREIVQEERGVDHVKTLRQRMKDWNEKMTSDIFSDVQAARTSLRELAFTDPMKSLEAQAYVTHFQGHFHESARLFDRLVELQPRNRRLRRDAEIATQRMRRHPEPNQVAQAYDRLATLDRQRREEEAKALAIARAEEEKALAGGAGSARENGVEARGETEPPQVAFLPPGAVRPPVRPPEIRRPAPPPPVTPVPREQEEPPAPPVQTPAPTQKEQPPAQPGLPSPQERPAPPLAPEQRPEIIEARKHFEQGDYVRSHLATQRILEENPNDRAAARQAMVTNSVVAAESSLTDPEAAVNVPQLEATVDQSLQLYDRGMNLYQRKQRNDALSMWEQAIQVCPANFLARKMIEQVNQEFFDEKWNRIMGNSRG